MHKDLPLNRYIEKLKFKKQFKINPIAKDCSTKQHYRINFEDDNSYIIVDTNYDKDLVLSLVRAHNIITNIGLSAPAVIDYCLDECFILTEDFGTTSYNKILSSYPNLEQELYSLAITILGKLATSSIPDSELPIHDALSFDKALTHSFQSYSIALNKNQEIVNVASEELSNIFKKLYTLLSNAKQTMVLRDYHIDNLMFLQNRNGYNKVGLLDIQDLSIGHPVYDLVSLLEDARRDVDKNVISNSKNIFLDLIPQINVEEFDYAYDVLGMQRSLRILWLFARISNTKDKEHYGKFIPRVKSYIRSRIDKAIFNDLRKWLNEHNDSLNVL
jgi:aminoglycoside/choline kinase family phosphotransferase